MSTDEPSQSEPSESPASFLVAVGVMVATLATVAEVMRREAKPAPVRKRARAA